ncbi:MAG TPA: four-helix bundle copper-binding protein [Cyclobacteriaceae bacterium]
MCDLCADECAKHAAEMDHCRRCAEACKTCAEECRAFAGVHQSIH